MSLAFYGMPSICLHDTGRLPSLKRLTLRCRSLERQELPEILQNAIQQLPATRKQVSISIKV
ncbi:MAG: hypothetical protein OYL97_01350 [Candidatus Poribacteria bacterium]|nr:hypothetical protein [Candidatus Poribacteria bacterium]